MLTRREKEVIALVAQGLSNREIAKSLEVAEDTVKSHLTHIFDKLGCDNRTEMVMRYAAGAIKGFLQGYICSICNGDCIVRGDESMPNDIAVVMSDPEKCFSFDGVCPKCTARIHEAITAVAKELGREASL